MAVAMVGREEELAILRDLVDHLPSRSGGVLIVGEAGIGKSHLVAWVEEHASDRSCRVLRGSCAPLGGDVPFAPLRATAGSMAADDATVLSDGAAGRAEWFARLDKALSTGPEAGTVLVVEDVHWADLSTLAYLAHLARNLPTAGLLVVTTFRGDGADEIHEAWAAEHRRCRTVMTLPLGPLSERETSELLVGVHSVDAVAARSLHRRSGGNPYLAVELARARPGKAPSDSLRAVLLVRLREMPRSATVVVAAAGLFARTVLDAELAAAAAGDWYAVRLAYERGLLVPVEGAGRRGAPRHPVLAEVAYAELTEAERRDLHAGLVSALEMALPIDASAAQLAEVAKHHLRAGQADDALSWSVRAAEAAAGQYAFAEAGTWYATALAVWPAATVATTVVPTRPALAAAAGRNLSVAGRHADVVDVLDTFLGHEPSARDAVPALQHRAWARFVLGDTSGAIADVGLALSLLDEDSAADIADAGLVYMTLAHIHGTCSRWRDARAAALRAYLLGVRGRSERVQALAHTIFGTAALIDGDERMGLRLLHAAMDTARRLGEPDDLALAAVCVTDHYLTAGRLATCVDVSESIRADLRLLAPQGHWLDDMLASNEASALFLSGQWDRAVEVALHAPRGIGLTALTAAQVFVARGDLEVGRQLLQEASGLDRVDQPQFHLTTSAVRAAIEMHECRPREALSIARAAAEVVSGTEQEAAALPLLLTGMRAAAVLRDEEQLEALVGALPGALSGALSDAGRAQLAAERAEAAGRPASGEWLAAAEEWDSAGRPYETAVAQVRAAEALLSGAGGRGPATEVLAAASEKADRLGATPLAREVAELARAARLSVPEPRPTPTPEQPVRRLGLTDREEQVLVLIAQGRTNREIGEVLYMSPKTASVHVTRILQKLGVTSRVQAAAVAARSGLASYEVGR